MKTFSALWRRVLRLIDSIPPAVAEVGICCFIGLDLGACFWLLFFLQHPTN